MPFHQNFHFSVFSVLAQPWCPLQLSNSCNRVLVSVNGTTIVLTSRLFITNVHLRIPSVLR